MTKYRCLWHKSTINHNILYFVRGPGLNSPNKGHCLWKARTSLAGRGFWRAICAESAIAGGKSRPVCRGSPARPVVTARNAIWTGASAGAKRARSAFRRIPAYKTQRACQPQTGAILDESNRRIGQRKGFWPEVQNSLPAMQGIDLSAAIPRYWLYRRQSDRYPLRPHMRH